MQQNTRPSFLLLFLLISFGSVSAVLFTPALPDIGRYFNVSQSSTQFTITVFLVGYALGQLLYGPLANRYGRKPALYIGIGTEIIASMLCIISASIHSFWLLVAARLLMALGASVGLKMSFTLVADTCTQPQATKLVSHLMIAFAITPAVGIALGGFIAEYWNWQGCFYVLGLYGLLLLYLSYRTQETAPELDPEALKLKRIIYKYGRKLKNKQLVTGALLVGCSTSFVYLFAALAPFIAMELMHLSPDQYGLWSLLPSLGIILGSQISVWLTDKLQTYQTILIGIMIMALGVAIIFAAFAYEQLTAVWLFLPMIAINLGMSFIFANTATIATQTAQDKASASAMMNFINMGLATLFVLLVGFFPTQSALVLPIVYALLILFSLVLIMLLMKQMKANTVMA